MSVDDGDVCAEVGEDHAAEGRGRQTGQLHHAHAAQGRHRHFIQALIAVFLPSEFRLVVYIQERLKKSDVNL